MLNLSQLSNSVQLIQFNAKCNFYVIFDLFLVLSSNFRGGRIISLSSDRFDRAVRLNIARKFSKWPKELDGWLMKELL